MALYNYDTTRIITNDAICFSTSEMRITTSSISFNLTAAANLDIPKQLLFLLSTGKMSRHRPASLSNYPAVSEIMKSARPVAIALPAAV